MAVYDDIDLAFSWNGDFNISRDGDLEDTSNDGLRSFIEDLHSISASAIDDWEFTPRRAAGLEDFVGESNSPITAENIHDRVRLALVSNGLVLEEDLEIRVIPVHIHKVLIIYKINATPTPLNRLIDNTGIVVQLVFDFLEQGVFFPDKTPRLQADT